jgi:Resolvase, N terminal domain
VVQPWQASQGSLAAKVVHVPLWLDPIETRPGFAKLLSRIEGNGVCTVIVEDASRFARDLVAQELGILLLINRGVRVLTANGDDLTDTSDPSRVMMRQIAGSFAQYEKARLVAKLRTARERKPRLLAQAILGCVCAVNGRFDEEWTQRGVCRSMGSKSCAVLCWCNTPPGSRARFAGPRRQLFRQREGAQFPSCLDSKVIPSFVRYRRLISER